jgi:histidine triad (HIT) family protein
MSQLCTFCKILQKEIPAAVVYEDDKILAFNDIRPAAPTHVLLIPKTHYDSISDVPAGDPILSYLAHSATKIALQLGLREGYRLVVNVGDNGGQTVYHLHLHLLGGRFMTWPPG